MHGFAPVLVSAVAVFMLGGLWYSPLMFAKPWVKSMGMDINDKAKMDAMRKSAGPAYLQTFVLAIVTSYIFWRLFQYLDLTSALAGAEAAFFICLGTVVVSKYTAKLFGQS